MKKIAIATMIIGMTTGMIGCTRYQIVPVEPNASKTESSKTQIDTQNNDTQTNTQTTNKITEEQAKQIMLNKVPEATILEFSYDDDEVAPKYDGKLIKDNYEYEIDVDSRSGNIIKFEQENISTNNSSLNTSTSNTQTTTKPSTSTSNTQTTTKPSTSTNKTQTATKPSTSTNNTQTTTKPSTSTSNNSYIGESKAKSIMLGKVPGGTFTSFHLDYDDGRAEYEGDLVKGDMKYDITVDANTGAIINFDSESRYDD